MKTARTEMGGFQKILERKRAELVRVLRERDSIAIEKSADQVDEIQDASERDGDSKRGPRVHLLGDVKAAPLRIHDGSSGTCTECDWATSPKRLAAVPWASRCIECQEAADSDGAKENENPSARLSSMPREGAVLRRPAVAKANKRKMSPF